MAIGPNFHSLLSELLRLRGLMASAVSRAPSSCRLWGNCQFTRHETLQVQESSPPMTDVLFCIAAHGQLLQVHVYGNLTGIPSRSGKNSDQFTCKILSKPISLLFHANMYNCQDNVTVMDLALVLYALVFLLNVHSPTYNSGNCVLITASINWSPPMFIFQDALSLPRQVCHPICKICLF